MIEIKTLATGSTGNCYWITDGSTPLLLECGISFKNIQKALDFRTSDIAGVLVTHEHMDHCRVIEDVSARGLDVYMSKGTKNALGIDHHRVKVVENKRQFRIGTWIILPFDTEHDVSEPFGFLLASDNGGKLLFITDSYYCRYKFSGITHLMLECNYSKAILDANVSSGRVHEVLKKRIMSSHFSLENVLEFLQANDLSKVQEIHLLHLSDSNSDEALFKKAVQEQTGKLVFVP